MKNQQMCSLGCFQPWTNLLAPLDAGAASSDALNPPEPSSDVSNASNAPQRSPSASASSAAPPEAASKKQKGRVLSGGAYHMNFRARMNSDAPEFLKEFLNYMLTIKGRSVNTVESYYLDLRTFFRFLMVYYGQASLEQFHEILIAPFTMEQLKKVRLSDIYAYLNFCMRTLENGDLARARKASCLRSFFKYMQKMNYIPENPTKDLEMPSLQKRLPKHLTLDESIEMLEHVESKAPARDFCMLTFFLNCGMRVSELVGINLGSIQDQALSIIGKGNKERIIYLNQPCLEALNAYLEERKKLTQIIDQDALFLSRTGRRISKRRVQQIVEYNLKKNGLFGYSTHKLRHTAATLLYQYGNVDIRVLKELLGHASLSTTEIYTHVSNEQVKEAVAKSPLKSVHPSAAGQPAPTTSKTDEKESE